MNWIEIDKNEFDELSKQSVLSHSVNFSTPPLHFFWDKNGAKNKDKSFGQHAFLYIIDGNPYTEGSKPRYFKKST